MCPLRILGRLPSRQARLIAQQPLRCIDTLFTLVATNVSTRSGSRIADQASHAARHLPMYLGYSGLFPQSIPKHTENHPYSNPVTRKEDTPHALTRKYPQVYVFNSNFSFMYSKKERNYHAKN